MTNSPAPAVPAGPLARVHRAVVLDQEALQRLRVTAVVGLILLNVCDLVLTRRLLGMGGVEANPLMALFIGSGWGVAIKIGLPVALAYRHLRAPLERKIVLGLCWMCVLYLGVVLWNAHMFDTALGLG
jgi:hypothetical protein